MCRIHWLPTQCYSWVHGQLHTLPLHFSVKPTRIIAVLLQSYVSKSRPRRRRHRRLRHLSSMYVMSQPKHILLLNRLATEAERDTNVYQKTHRVGQKKRGQFVLRLVYNCRNIDKISASNLAQIKVLTLNRNLFEPALENKVAPNDNTIISDKWQQFVLLLHQITEQNTQQQQNRYIK